MAADAVVNLIKDTVVLESNCLCRDVESAVSKSCVSNEQIVGVTERGEDVTIAISSITAPENLIVIAALTDFGVQVTKKYGRVALGELREHCAQVYVEAVNCWYRIPAVGRIRIDNVHSLGFR